MAHSVSPVPPGTSALPPSEGRATDPNRVAGLGVERGDAAVGPGQDVAGHDDGLEVDRVEAVLVRRRPHEGQRDGGVALRVVPEGGVAAGEAEHEEGEDTVFHIEHVRFS